MERVAPSATVCSHAFPFSLSLSSFLTVSLRHLEPPIRPAILLANSGQAVSRGTCDTRLLTEILCIVSDCTLMHEYAQHNSRHSRNLSTIEIPRIDINGGFDTKSPSLQRQTERQRKTKKDRRECRWTSGGGPKSRNQVESLREMFSPSPNDDDYYQNLVVTNQLSVT